AFREVLGRVEAREMLADDLVGKIALDALRTGVPARDAPRAVEHEDRVVGHALHQPAELLLGAADPLVGPALLGQVAHDDGESREPVVGRAHRADEYPSAIGAAVLAHAPGFDAGMAFAHRRVERP